MIFGRLSWFIGLSLIVGCNQPSFPVAPVRGTVKIDGQPMTQGKVMLSPVATGGQLNSGRPAFGYIQSNGSFSLSTYGNGDGAVVGDHWVSIINGVPQGAAAPGRSNSPVTKANFQRIVFPRKVVAVVADQQNEINIALTSQDLAKYAKVAKADN